MDRDFQNGVKRTFVELSRNHHLPEALKTKWLVVDSSKDKGEIADHILDAVSSFL